MGSSNSSGCNECRKRKEMEKNNCNPLEAIIENKIPVRTESRNSYYEDNNFMHKDNLKQIEYLSGEKVIAVVKNGDNDIKLLDKYFV